MHLTLVNPPFVFFRRTEVVFSQCLGILYVAAFARQHGHQVTVIDALHEGRNRFVTLPDGSIQVGLSNNEIIARIPAHTDLIGVSAPTCSAAPVAHELTSRIKDATNAVPVVLGGFYPSTQPSLALTSRADYVILGEGEDAVVELLDYLRRGDHGRVPKSVVPTAQPELLGGAIAGRVDFGNPPPPARDLVPFADYLVRSTRNLRGWRTASIITSRGCPFDCEFCSIHAVSSYKWRARRPANVLAEIDELVRHYGVNNLEIEDDHLTVNRARIIAILKGIIDINRRGYRLSWRAPNGIRIDSLDEELIRIISRSNCLDLCLPLEHGDTQILKNMRKKLSPGKVLEVMRLIYKYGIKSNVFLICGYPGETKERFANALSFYRKAKQVAPSASFRVFFAQPYPGTALFARCVREGYMPGDMFSTVEKLSRFSTADTVWFETPDFTKQEVKARRKLLLKSLAPEYYYYEKLREMVPRKLIDMSRTWHVGRLLLRGQSRSGRLRRPGSERTCAPEAVSRAGEGDGS